MYPISGQTRCDTLHKEIFIATEELPKPSISYDQLALILNNSINLNDYNPLQENIIYISFIINCKGQDFDYKTLKPIDNNLTDILFKSIKSNLTWTPAKQNKQEVDIQKTLILKIENGKFLVSDNNQTAKKKRK
jgi:hypothetical protein